MAEQEKQETIAEVKASVMDERDKNEAEVQYRQYVKTFAYTHGKTLEEAAETAECEEYRRYCEEVFGRRITRCKEYEKELK